MSQHELSFLTEEPIKLKLSEIAYQTVESDLSLFQLDSVNQLLNLVFTYFGKFQMKKDDDYLNKLEKVMTSLSLEPYQKEALKALVSEQMLTYENTKSLKRVSFRPHINEIHLYHDMNRMAARLTSNTSSLASYLSYLLDLYAKKNRAERTRIVFHKHDEQFHKALKKKKQLLIQTKYVEAKRYQPIDKLAIFDNEVILFACEDENQQLKLIELSSIVSIKLLDDVISIDERHFEKLAQYKMQKINLSSFRSYFDDPEQIEMLLNLIGMMNKGDA